MISDTGLLHAVAAPKSLARSVTNPQFSGPFRPRPPETTISASERDTSPSTFFVETTFTLAEGVVATNGFTEAIASILVTGNEFGLRVIIFIAVLIPTCAKALPPNTFFLTTKPLLVSGKSIAPVTSPAFKKTLRLGAIAFPSILFDNTSTVALIFLTSSEITLVKTCTSALESEFSERE